MGAVLETIKRSRTIRQASVRPGPISDGDLSLIDSYSIFSDSTEGRPEFENEILRSRAYRKVYYSVKKARHSRPEPVANLLDEDLIDLDFPVLPYSKELQQEMLGSGTGQRVLGSPPSDPPSKTWRNSGESLGHEISAAEGSPIAQQPPTDATLEITQQAVSQVFPLFISESSGRRRMSHEGLIPIEPGFNGDDILGPRQMSYERLIPVEVDSSDGGLPAIQNTFNTMEEFPLTFEGAAGPDEHAVPRALRRASSLNGLSGRESVTYDAFVGNVEHVSSLQALNLEIAPTPVPEPRKPSFGKSERKMSKIPIKVRTLF